MPNLRLAIEIDVDIHPELHAALSAIDNGSSRGERLKQWAAAGLIWEQVRLHGPSMLPIGAASRQSVTPAPATPAIATPVAEYPGERLERQPADIHRGRGERPDFVDLAISARTPSPSPQSLPKAPFAVHIEAAARNLPVLLDMVEVDEHDRLLMLDERRDVSSPPVLDDRMVGMAALPRLPADAAGASGQATRTEQRPAADDEDTPVAPAAAVLTIAPRVHNAVEPAPQAPARTGTRTRLMRMKERGLFSNG